MVEYKKEAFHLFESLLNRLKLDFTTILMNLTLVQSQTKDVSENQQTQNYNKTFDKKISRNEPCPCGSGKKYKRCCGAL